MLQVESYKKGIVLSTAFNLLNKGLVFVNGLLIAYYFGTQIKMDIYFYAYNTVLIVATFISGINTTVVIPESIRLRIQHGEIAAFRFLNIFIFSNIFLASLLCVIFLADPLRVFTLISQYDTETLARQNSILFMTIPLLLLVTITSLLTEILTSYRFFTIPIIAGIINAVFSLLFVIFYHALLDVKSILLGLLISYSINIVLLLTLMKRYLNWPFSFRQLSLAKRIWSNILFVQMGNLVTSFGSYAPLYFLSGTGMGVIASLNYAQQLVTQPTSFITNQVVTVSRIKISEMYAHRNFTKLNEVFSSTVRFLVFILLPVSGLLFLYSHEIITLLFKRGSFNETSVKQSSDLLRYLALSLPFTAVISIAANLYFAAQLIRISIAYQVLSNLILITLIALLIQRVGYTGYPIAYLMVNILNVIVAYFFCMRISPLIKYSSLLKYLALMLTIHIAIVALVEGINSLFHRSNMLQMMTAGTFIYLVLITGVSFAFRLNTDFNTFVNQIPKKILRRIQ